jgi:hypothetical protein
VRRDIGDVDPGGFRIKLIRICAEVNGYLRGIFRIRETVRGGENDAWRDERPATSLRAGKKRDHREITGVEDTTDDGRASRITFMAGFGRGAAGKDCQCGIESANRIDADPHADRARQR